MNSKEVKDIRKQVRNVCKELLNEEQIKVIMEKCEDIIGQRLTVITAEVRKTMQDMLENNKNTNSFLIRQAAQGKVSSKDEDQKSE